MSGDLGTSVCIIGAGTLGLVATKNFLEEGFNVTTVERNDYIGGLWHATSDTAQTSALETTVANISKRGTPFTEFPVPDHVSTQPTAKEMQEYLESYAKQFDLNRHIRLSTTVTSVTRLESRRKWLVNMRCVTAHDEAVTTYWFDRLIVSTGSQTRAVLPCLENVDRFRGEVVHSQQIKSPQKYENKTVLIIGLSSTAADTINSLKLTGAKKIYVSHRSAPIVLPRFIEGKPTDYILTFRSMLTVNRLKWLSSQLANKLGRSMMEKLQNEHFPELVGHPALAASRPKISMDMLIPIVSDDLAANLTDGTGESVQSVSRIIGPDSVLLKDGRVLVGIDSVICCTGGSLDISSLLPPSADPFNAANSITPNTNTETNNHLQIPASTMASSPSNIPTP